MTKPEFQSWPWLLFEHQVRRATGYAAGTVEKLVDCGVLESVRPDGCGQRKVRKVQVARMLKCENWLDIERWRSEPEFMGTKSVSAWTGYSASTLSKLVEAGALDMVRMAGLSRGKFLKRQVARLIGLE